MYIFLTFSRIKTANGRMDLYFSDYINIATGRMYWDSDWAYEFIVSGTVLILPLGVYNEAAAGHMGLYFYGLY